MSSKGLPGAAAGPAALAEALTALADLGVHPVGVTVDGALIALQLTPDDQAAVLSDAPRRERIVTVLKAHGFLYVTLTLEARDPLVR